MRAHWPILFLLSATTCGGGGPFANRWECADEPLSAARSTRRVPELYRSDWTWSMTFSDGRVIEVGPVSFFDSEEAPDRGGVWRATGGVDCVDSWNVWLNAPGDPRLQLGFNTTDVGGIGMGDEGYVGSSIDASGRFHWFQAPEIETLRSRPGEFEWLLKHTIDCSDGVCIDLGDVTVRASGAWTCEPLGFPAGTIGTGVWSDPEGGGALCEAAGCGEGC